ncbi:MAG: hypothetical protein WED00_00425 [Aquisalimonadaceae bacterium]
MSNQQDHVYRNGRLLLPRDIADRSPSALAEWLGGVPIADRARAFRALPLNVAAAAFLVMEPRMRIGLLAGLNPRNIRYLISIAGDALLLDTLEQGGEDVRSAVFAELPDWRAQRMQTALEESRRRQADEALQLEQRRVKDVPSRSGLARLRGWLKLTAVALVR